MGGEVSGGLWSCSQDSLLGTKTRGLDGCKHSQHYDRLPEARNPRPHQQKQSQTQKNEGLAGVWATP